MSNNTEEGEPPQIHHLLEEAEITLGEVERKYIYRNTPDADRLINYSLAASMLAIAKMMEANNGQPL